MVLLKRLWVLPILAILAIGLVAAACGDDDEEPTGTRTPAASPTAAGTAATATPAPGATEMTIVAAALGFDQGSFEATSGQPFTITLDNQDTVSHTLVIYTEEGGDEIAGVEPSTVSPGSKGTLTTTITEPGEYYFQCDFHPQQMNGTLTVN
jgi:plastocyanin